MREPIDQMKARLVSGLEQAGRNKNQISKQLDKLEEEIKKQTGTSNVKWTEEYYLYLLENYKQAISIAIDLAVGREEYEWAHALTERRDAVSEQLEAAAMEK